MKKEVGSQTTTLQRSIILILAVLLVFAFTGTVTLAVYTRFEQDSTTIHFGDPVAVYVTDENGGGTITFDDEVAYPGTPVDMDLGFGMQYPSSSAYIRAKLQVTTSNAQALLDEGLIEFSDADDNNDGEPDSRPHPDKWVLMDFNFIDLDQNGVPDDGVTSDLWYVFAERTWNDTNDDYVYQATVVANNGATDNEMFYGFIHGKVKVSEELTNEYANSELTFTFKISAIQSTNYSVPVSSDTSYYEKDVYGDGSLQRIYIYNGFNWPLPL